jgi:GDP-mannose 6-dehydrogenase
MKENQAGAAPPQIMSPPANSAPAAQRNQTQLTLGADEVHLRRVDLELAASGIAQWLPILSADEQARAARFHFDRDRHRFVATRGILRQTLGAYLAIDPKALTFQYSKKDKPALGGAEAASGLAFNVSHSGKIALLAFTRARQVGVDVEQIRHNSDTTAIAARFFFSRRAEKVGGFASGTARRSVFPHLDSEGGLHQGYRRGIVASASRVRRLARPTRSERASGDSARSARIKAMVPAGSRRATRLRSRSVRLWNWLAAGRRDWLTGCRQGFCMISSPAIFATTGNFGKPKHLVPTHLKAMARFSPAEPPRRKDRVESAFGLIFAVIPRLGYLRKRGWESREMSRSISVFGLGYVGTVTAACLAHKGNHVIGVDLSPAKVEAMDLGKSPIVEPGVGELISDAHKAGRLRATSDASSAVMNSDVSILCVGTPSLRNGKLDLGHIEPVCLEIGESLRKKAAFHLVVLRSTVLPGTAESIVIPALEKASGKTMGQDFGVCVNPEFMREGTAVADFLEPSVTIIGASVAAHSAALRELYAWAPGTIFETSFRSAELVKYISNAWHAVKVSFANEVGTLAKELRVDAESVTEIFAADTKLNISAKYLAPGFAFGGSCLPKDVRALNYRARELDLHLPLFQSILPSNDAHLDRAVELVLKTGKRNVAVLGLSFKAATDDLRESPQVQLVKRLLGEGRQIRIWDDNVSLGRLIGSNRQYIEEVIPHIGSLLCSSLEETLRSAEVVVISTRGVDRDTLQRNLRSDQFVIDLVNLEKARRPVAASYDGMCW